MTGHKAFFDTSLFIYALERKDEKVRALFSQALTHGRICTSVITIMEYCTGCYKNGKESVAERFLKFLKDQFCIVQDVNKDIALEAARIRAEYPAFKAMDALQLACTRYADCSVFYTSDKQLLQYADDKLLIKTIFIQ